MEKDEKEDETMAQGIDSTGGGTWCVEEGGWRADGCGLSILGGGCLEDEEIVTGCRDTLDAVDLQGQRGGAVEQGRLAARLTTVQELDIAAE